MTTNEEAGVKTEDTPQHSVLNSAFPVLLPEDDALFMSEVDFQAFIKQEITKARRVSLVEIKQEIESIDTADTKTLSGSETVSVSSLKRPASTEADNDRVQKAPFVAGLEQHHAHHRTLDDLAKENKALTENADVTNISSQNAVVDLFYELGENTARDKLKSLLEASWNEDKLLTLKIIFNARSIHLGKSSKVACYKALGWLAENHPLTLLTNLQWLVRPVIAKKAPSAAESAAKTSGAADQQSTPPKTETKIEHVDEDFDMVDADDADPAKAHDVRYGVSHGYWKDLLNLVVFAANDELKCDGDPASLLSQKTNNSKESKRKRKWDQAAAKEVRQQKKLKQNEHVQEKLKHDAIYHALHITVARLFAKQLKEDKALLDSGKKSDLKKLSLAAKWAPTHSEFHDKHTFILSSIAEILFPDAALHCPDADNRELYLRHVREHLRKQYTSPLRKALSIVERDIAANTFSNIKYERVPSLAMDRYSGLFMKKDYEHFQGYIQDVTKGTAKISGAVLLPSTLIAKARTVVDTPTDHLHRRGKMDFKAAKAAAMAQIYADVVDGQWSTLLQRVRDAGTLQSSIAICDVSGSMLGPRLQDGSCPMDSAIGLSLLIAEVTAPPFGGGFITFSETPTYLSVGGTQDSKGLVDKMKYISDSDWGMNTNFIAVFEDIILPMAMKNNLKQEDMVKQIFVFSDMQFDSAHRGGSDRWTSSYEHLKKKYADAGYDMPRLIFWNLAAHSTDKPTTMSDTDTALVSGYSQGMLKAFLETGTFDEEEELVEEEVEAEGKDGMTEIKKVRKKIDPLTVVKKAVGHKAYSMLEVVD
jgi:hypothetical protein